ncbi:ORF19 [Fowl aviadenovirus 5]|uniref:ORF19 n=1 Tax=Fowl aviadenovirus 5 TaxID=172861 RepID=A0A896IC19_9ADEN|nr:ORF19 [Fowl aviadenovirus 5]
MPTPISRSLVIAIRKLAENEIFRNVSEFQHCLDTSDPRWMSPGFKSDITHLAESHYVGVNKKPSLAMWKGDTTYYFEDRVDAVKRMREAGLFVNKTSKDLILLVHDFDPRVCRYLRVGKWDGTYEETNVLMEKFLRMHTLMTPYSIVVLFDWREEVRDACQNVNTLGFESRGKTPSYYASKVEAYFLNDMDKTLRVHCIGLSLGSTACASMSRWHQVRTGRKFFRIVAIDPPIESFNGYYNDHGASQGLMGLFSQNGEWRANGDLIKMVGRNDAEYVVVLASSMGSYGYPYAYGADEFIRSSIFGQKHEACETRAWWVGKVCARSYYGLDHCESINIPFRFHRTDGQCYHLMPILTAMKMLDTNQSLQMLSYKNYRPSAWNMYVTGRDYTHPEQYYDLDLNDQHTLVREEDMSSANLLLVVSRYSSAELWTYDKFFYYSEGLPSGYVGRWYYLTYIPKNPIELYGRSGARLVYIRLYQGVSMLSGNFSPEAHKVYPMTAHQVREYSCFQTYRYTLTGTLKYDCHETGHPFTVPRWRPMIEMPGLEQTLVPPPCGCLKFRKLFKDYVTVKQSRRIARSGNTISLSAEGGGRADLQAIMTFSGGKHRIVLSSGWDACNVTRGKLRVTLDRAHKNIWVSGPNVTEYFNQEIWLVYELVIVKMNLTWIPRDKLPSLRADRKARDVGRMSGSENVFVRSGYSGVGGDGFYHADPDQLRARRETSTVGVAVETSSRPVEDDEDSSGSEEDEEEDRSGEHIRLGGELHSMFADYWKDCGWGVRAGFIVAGVLTVLFVTVLLLYLYCELYRCCLWARKQKEKQKKGLALLSDYEVPYKHI